MFHPPSQMMLSPLTFSIWLESLGLINVDEQGLFLLAIPCHLLFFLLWVVRLLIS